MEHSFTFVYYWFVIIGSISLFAIGAYYHSVSSYHEKKLSKRDPNEIGIWHRNKLNKKGKELLHKGELYFLAFFVFIVLTVILIPKVVSLPY